MKNRMFWIRLPYWLGILADALWAVALFSPSVYGILTGDKEFNADLQIRIVMGIGGSLMTGWTFLLVWGVINPVIRRGVALLTAFPVITGLFIVSVIGNVEGDSFNFWILFKLIILFILFILSYVLATRMNKTTP